MTERVEHVNHPSCRCRRCKCERFTHAVEALLRDGVPEKVIADAATLSDEGNGNLTTEEYALLFESQVRELHTELVTR